WWKTAILAFVGVTTIFLLYRRTPTGYTDLDNKKNETVLAFTSSMRNHTEVRKALQQLQSEMDGTIHFRDDEQDDTDGFAQACRVYYASAVQNVHTAPYAVLEVAHEKDVQKAIVVLSRLRRTYDFPFRIRSGGHNKAGYSTVANGAVLSLQKMNQLKVVEVDDEKDPIATTATARMQPAVLVQQFLQEVLANHGYAGVVGYCPTVAEAGFILGGGIGLQSRRYGLGLDNVVGMRVVLADGSVRHVSHNSTDPLDVDLFWALRGAGGGSFGVITELDYQIHKASNRIVYGALRMQQASDRADFLCRLGRKEQDILGNLMVMHDQTDTIGLMWSGQDDSEVNMAELYLTKLVDDLVPTPTPRDFKLIEGLWTKMFVDESSFSNTDVYAVRCWYGFLYPQNNTEGVWQDILRYISNAVQDSSGFLLPDIEFWGGAIHDVSPNTTAFPHRSALFNVGVLLTVSNDTPDAESVFQEEVAKVEAIWPKVSKYLTGSYVNYPTTTLLSGNYARAHWGDAAHQDVRAHERLPL
ncbi:MAG: FAD-dependent oxidoreductase, partial [Caldilineaceae bacterium]|nr:FAD-dependent oxidoreductase [Caldilineaceae bacterium]